MNQNFHFPDMAFVRQKLFSSSIKDVSGAIKSAFEPLSALRPVRSGEIVAVAVGSRNIDHLDAIVLNTLYFLSQKGYKPLIIPAMGSHGGASPEGQKQILERFHITDNAMKVPILADMAAESVGKLPFGLNLYVSKNALSADHIVLINRVKPHTKFKADIGSGLCKMLTIGLGKEKGASEFHQFAVDHTFSIIEDAAIFLLNKLNVLFGVALLEDGYGKLAHIETLFPNNLVQREKELLKDATRMMGSIPFDPVDILIVDYIGKDISGIGMDSNVTGRHRDIVGDIFAAPHIKRIFVRDLSPASEGNANGIGLADFTTSRLVNKIDIYKTFINAITAISPEKAAIPIHFDTDRKCLESCIKTTGVTAPKSLRVVRIKNTASLEYLQISRSFEKDMEANTTLKQLTPWKPIRFDQSDDLFEFDRYD